MEDSLYDAVIIGAGIGGLFCANYLAMKGKKVLLLEQHRTPGGYICGFYRKNYYFDGANNSFSSHGTIFPLLEELNLGNRIEFRRHRMSQRVASVNINFKYNSFDNFEAAMLKAFKEEDNIEKFMKVLRDFYGFFGVLEKMNNPMMYTGIKKVNCFMKYVLITLKKETRKYINSIMKYGMMSSGDFVSKFFLEGTEAYKFFRTYGNPNQNAIVLGAMISEFIEDKWYPEGGEQHFADLLAKNASSYGAEVMYSANAREIITKEGKAVGVRTDQGSFTARNVVIACDYRKAFLNMLDNKNLLNKKFLLKLKNAETSESLFTVYLGLKCDASLVEECIGGNRLNYAEKIVIKDLKECNDKGFFKDVTISIFSPSVLSKNISGEGYSSVTIQCLCPNKWMNHWGNGDKEEYKRLKKGVQEQVLSYFKAAAPELADKIEYIESATPKTYEHYTKNTDGAYCAWSWEPGESFFNDLKIHVKTPVKNLYCCSDWCYKIGGMVSSMIGAKIISTRYIK